MREKVKTILR